MKQSQMRTKYIILLVSLILLLFAFIFCCLIEERPLSTLSTEEKLLNELIDNFGDHRVMYGYEKVPAGYDWINDPMDMGDRRRVSYEQA